MSSEESGSLADQAAAWVPPWARPGAVTPSAGTAAPDESVKAPAEVVEAPAEVVELEVAAAEAEVVDVAAEVVAAAEAEVVDVAAGVVDVPLDEPNTAAPIVVDEPAVEAAVAEPDAEADAASEEPDAVGEPDGDPLVEADVADHDPVAEAPDSMDEAAAEVDEPVAAAALRDDVAVDDLAAAPDQPADDRPVAEEPVDPDVPLEPAVAVSAVPGGVPGENPAPEQLVLDGTTPDEPVPELSEAELQGAVEAILLVIDEPTTEIILAQIIEQPTDRITAMLEKLVRDYADSGRGFELRRVAGGWRLYTRPEYAAYVEKFVLDGQQVRLTQAALETLAVIAYKQPVSRSRISAIRGVNCDGVVRTLVTRGLIEECGSEPESGAFLYRTTTLFLEKLGLDGVDQLPPLAPFLPDDIDEIADAQR